MIERIADRIYDILQADARLYAGGNAWPAGFTGVARVESPTDWHTGYVNLVDEPYNQDTNSHRPAVYQGLHGIEASDKLEFETISAIREEYRLLMLPLVIAVQADTNRLARKQRNQLRHNVKIILLDHLREPGYWWQLTMPGDVGPFRETTKTTAVQGVSEATATLPLAICYIFRPDSDA